MILLPVGAIIGGVVGQTVAHSIGLEAPLLVWPLTIAFGALGLVAWAYSPLPDNTGGPIMSASGHGYWGFEPSEDDEVSEA